MTSKVNSLVVTTEMKEKLKLMIYNILSELFTEKRDTLFIRWKSGSEIHIKVREIRSDLANTKKQTLLEYYALVVRK